MSCMFNACTCYFMGASHVGGGGGGGGSGIGNRSCVRCLPASVQLDRCFRPRSNQTRPDPDAASKPLLTVRLAVFMRMAVPWRHLSPPPFSFSFPACGLLVHAGSCIAGWACCWCMARFQTGIATDSMDKVKQALWCMPANVASGDLFFRAVEDNKPEVVRELIKSGGNPAIRMANGQLPMESAAKLGFWECIKVFYDAGALPPNGEVSVVGLCVSVSVSVSAFVPVSVSVSVSVSTLAFRLWLCVCV